MLLLHLLWENFYGVKIRRAQHNFKRLLEVPIARKATESCLDKDYGQIVSVPGHEITTLPVGYSRNIYQYVEMENLE